MTITYLGNGWRVECGDETWFLAKEGGWTQDLVDVVEDIVEGAVVSAKETENATP